MYGKRYGNNFFNLKNPQLSTRCSTTEHCAVFRVDHCAVFKVDQVGVFDQALYAKAVEVTWKHPDKFKTTIIIRPGVFHTICTLLAIVGKRFQDAGLRDLCIESGVTAD